MQRLDAAGAELGVEQGEGGAAGAVAAGGRIDPQLGEVGVAAAELEVVAERHDRVADRGAALLDEPRAAQARIAEQAGQGTLEGGRLERDALVGVERAGAGQELGEVVEGRGAEMQHAGRMAHGGRVTMGG